MKTVFRLALLIFAVFMCAPQLSSVEAAKYTFTYGTTATPESLRGIAEDMFLKEIETLSNGEIAFNRSWGGVLVNNQEGLLSVQDGIIDIGQINPNFYPRQLILNNAFSLLMQLPVDYIRRLEFFDDCFKELPELDAEIERYNQKLIYNYNVTHYVVISTKPITKVADFAGTKSRAAARWLLALLKDSKATPISMPLSDVPMSFQTNALDSVLLSVDATDMMGMLEVAPYALLVREFPVSTPYYMSINADAYNSLPKELQEVIHKAAASARVKFAERYNELLENILKKWEANPKYNVTVAGPEFIETWTGLEGNKANFETWVKEATDAGLKDSRKKLETIYAIRDAAVKAEEGK